MDQLYHGHGGEMRRPAGHEAALRAVQKPPAKPWRGGAGSVPAPTPPKVYRVEPREFRELVQRLTGAPASARRQQQQQQQVLVAPTQPAVAVRAGDEELYASAPWCSFPLLGPASTMDAHHGNGALI